MQKSVKPIKLAKMGVGAGGGGSHLLVVCLYTLQFPYIIPGLVPTGFNRQRHA